MIWYSSPPFGGAGVVTSFNTRTGAITLLESDIVAALGYTPADAALFVPYAGATGDVNLGTHGFIGKSFKVVDVPGRVFTVDNDGFSQINSDGSGANLADSGLSWSSAANPRTWGINPGDTFTEGFGSSTFLFASKVQSNVAPVDPNDLVRLQDIGGVGGVTSFNTRTGAVTLLDADVTAAVGQELGTSGTPSFQSLELTNGALSVDNGDVVINGGDLFFNNSFSAVNFHLGVFINTINDGNIYMYPQQTGGDIIIRDKANSQSNVIFGDDGSVANLGYMLTGGKDLNGFDLTPLINQISDYRLLIGYDRSGSQGEIDFMSLEGTTILTEPGFNWYIVTNAGVETLLMQLNHFGLVINGPVAPVVNATSDISTLFLTVDPVVNTIVSRTVAEVADDLLFRSETNSVILALGQTVATIAVTPNMPGTGYSVVITPTNAAMATAMLTGYFIDTKTISSFNVNFLVAPGAVTIGFDFIIKYNNS